MPATRSTAPHTDRTRPYAPELQPALNRLQPRAPSNRLQEAHIVLDRFLRGSFALEQPTTLFSPVRHATFPAVQTGLQRGLRGPKKDDRVKPLLPLLNEHPAKIDQRALTPKFTRQRILE